ncbi:MAG TPA: hypothetical protein PLF40_33125 [Kofleriaceae bacterium]|nr:hypothetical protein [Kofleriaceae bacterium]
MYLGLKQPWRTTAVQVAISVDAPPATVDASGTKPKKRSTKPRVPGTSDSSDGNDGGSEETAPPVLAASDRALQWHGSDFGMPPRTLDMAQGGDDGRPMSDSEINAGLRSAGILECVLQTATGTDLQATITVKLLVDGTGKVSKHRVQAPRYLQEHGLPSCVAKALARARFAATGAATLVTAPFSLGN